MFVAEDFEETAVTRVCGRLFEVSRGQRQRGTVMSEKDTGPQAGVKGVVEGVKGKVKEVVGTVTGKEELRREGEAQEEKARALREVAAKEAEADKARLEAKAHEADQRTHQN